MHDSSDSDRRGCSSGSFDSIQKEKKKHQQTILVDDEINLNFEALAALMT
jgi:hypothetical protein